MAMGAPGGRGGDDDELDDGAVFAEINITPLTDIFLVLLIIFMVGASMAVDAASGAGKATSEGGGVQVELPRGSARDLAPGSDDVTVSILADGRLLLDGAEQPEGALPAALTAAARQKSGAALILQADEGVPHGRVVAVMEAARAAGFARLAVATRGE